MKASELAIGSLYRARVSGKLVAVRLDSETNRTIYRGLGAFRRKEISTRTTYNVTNIDTGRQLIFKSAARFIRPLTFHRGETAITLVNEEAQPCPPASPKS